MSDCDAAARAFEAMTIWPSRAAVNRHRLEECFRGGRKDRANIADYIEVIIEKSSLFWEVGKMALRAMTIFSRST